MSEELDALVDDRWETVAIVDPDGDPGRYPLVHTVGLTALGRPELAMLNLRRAHLVVAQYCLTFVGRLSITNELVDGRTYSAGMGDMQVEVRAADPRAVAYVAEALQVCGSALRVMILDPVIDE